MNKPLALLKLLATELEAMDRFELEELLQEYLKDPQTDSLSTLGGLSVGIALASQYDDPDTILSNMKKQNIKINKGSKGVVFKYCKE